MRRLPDAELEVMKVLWELGPGASRADLEGGLAPFGWAANTINTYKEIAGPEACAAWGIE